MSIARMASTVICFFLLSLSYGIDVRKDFEVSVYFAPWEGRQFYELEKHMSHVNKIFYAFWDVNPDGHIIVKSSQIDFGTNYDRKLSVNEAIDLLKKTDISGTAIPQGNLIQAAVFKTRHPDIKLVLSIGGWGAKNFSKAFSSEKSRMTFIDDASKIMRDFTVSNNSIPVFDGFDIDWEYPRVLIGGLEGDVSPDDTMNLHSVVIALRKELGNNAIISLALPHGNNDLDGGSIDNFFKGINGKKLSTAKEFIDSVSTLNLMGYDFMAFAPYTIPNAPLHSPAGMQSIDDGVKLLLDNGVPPDKILFGAPIYGRLIGGQKKGMRGLNTAPDITNNGMGIQLPPVTNALGDQFPCAITWLLYRDIELGDFNVFTSVDDYCQTVSYWDEQGGISGKASKITKNQDLITSIEKYTDCFMSFDSPKNITDKCRYIRSNNLAGIFFWEVAQDKDYDSSEIIIDGKPYPLSLVKAAVKELSKK